VETVRKLVTVSFWVLGASAGVSHSITLCAAEFATTEQERQRWCFSFVPDSNSTLSRPHLQCSVHLEDIPSSPEALIYRGPSLGEQLDFLQHFGLTPSLWDGMMLLASVPQFHNLFYLATFPPDKRG
jgi:hypothetical protein